MDLTTILAVLAIGGALLLGAMSPGPSFVVVVRAAAGSRGEGLASALGMGVGGVVFAVAALAGLTAVLAQAPWLFGLLKLAGGCYLLVLALRLWRHGREPLDEADLQPEGARARRRWTMRVGLTTQLSNPKAAVVYASVFAALLPQSPSLPLALAIIAVVFVVECGWYVAVAFAFSSRGPRALYRRSKTVIDRLAATALALLGGHLAFTTARDLV